MHIAYYCQHVLGIGHFHRSLAICRELSRSHRVSLILGGPEVQFNDPDIQVFQLPGLQMDENFKNLRPTSGNLHLNEVKEQRKTLLYSWFETNRPDFFLVELYPFGRKAFRFELDPVLQGIRENRLPPCRCLVSLRDILVERPDDREKFEKRVVKTLNTWFDGVLVHADDRIVRLEETFNSMESIRIPVHYTGFITRKPTGNGREKIRKELGLSQEQVLITVSIGGGNVGGELLNASIKASALLDSSQYRMQLFSGPYLPEREFEQLQLQLHKGTSLHRFTDNLPGWLEASDLSISMAGYNTSMNIITAGIPALVFPFNQNREQRYRIEKLQPYSTITLLEKEDLEMETLAGLIQAQCHKPRYNCPINLDGAEQTGNFIATL